MSVSPLDNATRDKLWKKLHRQLTREQDQRREAREQVAASAEQIIAAGGQFRLLDKGPNAGKPDLMPLIALGYDCGRLALYQQVAFAQTLYSAKQSPALDDHLATALREFYWLQHDTLRLQLACEHLFDEPPTSPRFGNYDTVLAAVHWLLNCVALGLQNDGSAALLRRKLQIHEQSGQLNAITLDRGLHELACWAWDRGVNHSTAAEAQGSLLSETLPAWAEDEGFEHVLAAMLDIHLLSQDDKKGLRDYLKPQARRFPAANPEFATGWYATQFLPLEAIALARLRQNEGLRWPQTAHPLWDPRLEELYTQARAAPERPATPTLDLLAETLSALADDATLWAHLGELN